MIPLGRFYHPYVSPSFTVKSCKFLCCFSYLVYKRAPEALESKLFYFWNATVGIFLACDWLIYKRWTCSYVSATILVTRLSFNHIRMFLRLSMYSFKLLFIYSYSRIFCLFMQFLLFVVLAGKDKSVVLWSIHDHISTLATDDKHTETPVIQARGVFHGHDDTVEDVQFSPFRYLTTIFYILKHNLFNITAMIYIIY